ncbi:hypothetical protein AB0I77_15510 [Streptomyces sp. NPDC050619]|uniref:hypothetical protein n=1 Tax=Streptomyces sp. NPDC050619 TaxID=3157214 RepID=UPI00342F8D85
MGEVATVIAAVVALFAVCGGYVQFVLKRSLLPCVEFDVEFALLHRGPSQAVGEVACVVRNVGPNMAVVENVRIRCRYRLAGDPEDRYPGEGAQPRFAHSLAPGDAIVLVEERTFVQPAVAQRYGVPVALPAAVQIVDILGLFDYRIDLGKPTNLLIQLFARPSKKLELDWRKGIRDHTARRTFFVGSDLDT